uniref:N1221 domain-containing protein n=1 Tax=Macrostomum lignano TaxID=282301 RepID=A0A1I8FQ05_9PLAT
PLPLAQPARRMSSSILNSPIRTPTLPEIAELYSYSEESGELAENYRCFRSQRVPSASRFSRGLLYAGPGGWAECQVPADQLSWAWRNCRLLICKDAFYAAWSLLSDAASAEAEPPKTEQQQHSSSSSRQQQPDSCAELRVLC